MLWFTIVFTIVLYLVFFAPLAFQIFAGTKARKGKFKLSFNKVCLISIGLQIIIGALSISSFLRPNPNNYDYGLGVLFIIALSACALLGVLFAILLQYLLVKPRSKATLEFSNK